MRKILSRRLDTFHGESYLRQLAVAGSLGVGEQVVLAGLLRRPGGGVLVLNSLIAGVGNEFRVGTQRIRHLTGCTRSCNFSVWRFFFPLA